VNVQHDRVRAQIEAILQSWGMAPDLRATPAADPPEPVLVAGDPEEAVRQRRLRAGIPVPAAPDTPVRGICGRPGAAHLPGANVAVA
jgi:LDH2 family malate/lactate/ureidoglycolate dehydrogenase